MKLHALILTLACLAAAPAFAIDKNVASQYVELVAIDSATGRPKTGDSANLTAYVSIDGDASPDALTDTSATEVSSTNAPGVYRFDLSQAETNGKALLFSGKSSTSGVDLVPRVVYTVPAYFAVQSIESDGMANVDVEEWRGTQPGNVDGNSFLPANVAAYNGNTTRAAMMAGWLDAGRVPANAEQIAGDANAAAYLREANELRMIRVPWTTSAAASGAAIASAISGVTDAIILLDPGEYDLQDGDENGPGRLAFGVRNVLRGRGKHATFVSNAYYDPTASLVLSDNCAVEDLSWKSTTEYGIAPAGNDCTIYARRLYIETDDSCITNQLYTGTAMLVEDCDLIANDNGSAIEWSAGLLVVNDCRMRGTGAVDSDILATGGEVRCTRVTSQLGIQVSSTGAVVLAKSAVRGPIVITGATATVTLSDVEWDRTQVSYLSGATSAQLIDLDAAPRTLALAGTTGVKIGADAITASTFDESTAYPVKSADTGDTQILRKGAGSITGATIEAAAGEGGGGGATAEEVAAEVWETSPIAVDEGGAVTLAVESMRDIWRQATEDIGADEGEALAAILDAISEGIVGDIDIQELGEAIAPIVAAELVDSAAAISAVADAVREEMDANSKLVKIDALVGDATTIDTLTSQTVFTLDAGPGDDDAIAGAVAIVFNQADPTQFSRVVVDSYDASEQEVTLEAAPVFEVSSGDTFQWLYGGTAVIGTAPILEAVEEVKTDTEKIIQRVNTQ